MSNIPKTEEEYLQYWSKDLGETLDFIKLEFEEVVTEVKNDEKFKDMTEEQIRNTARNRYSMRKAREKGSNAIPWEGIVIGIGDLIDTVAKQRRVTEAAFKADSMKTMKGWIYNEVFVKSDADGKPLYPETDGNKKFGRANKPLPEHSWLRTIYLFVKPIDPKTKLPAGPPQPAVMIVNNQYAINPTMPLMKTVKFKAINKTGTEDSKLGEYRINHSAFTKFDAITIKDFPPIETILAGITSHFVSLGEMDAWHVKNESNKARWIVTEGSVSNLNLEPHPKTQNMSISLYDESLTFGGSDKTAIMCWVPTDRNIEIDFGQESRIYIIGRPNRGKAKDPVTKAVLEGVPGDVSINVYGVFAPEMFKVSPAVLPVTPQSVGSEEKW